MNNRVIAIRNTDKENKKIYIYGYGNYVGEEECPKLHNLKNPKIILDNGEVVWGFECWWTDNIKKIENDYKNFEFIEVMRS